MFFPSGKKMTTRQLKEYINSLDEKSLDKPICLIHDQFDGNVRHLEMVGETDDQVTFMFSKNLEG